MQEQKTLADYFKDCLTDEGQLNTASLLRVQNVEIRMEERKMVVRTVTDQILDPAFRQGLEETIAENFRGRLTVDLEVELENTAQSDGSELQERMEDAWNYVLEEEQRLRPMCYHILKNTEPEFLTGGRIRLPLPQEAIHLLQFNGCLHSLEILMEKMVGQPVRVLAEAVMRDPRIDEMREARIQSKQEEFIRTGTAQTADTAETAGMPEDADTPAAGSSQRAEDESPAGKLIPVEPLPWEEEAAAAPAENAAGPAAAVREEPVYEPAAPAYRSIQAAYDPAEPGEEEDGEGEEDVPKDEALFGRAIRGKIGEYTAMEDGKRLILYGVVTSVSSREIKGGKTLVQLSLTDYQHEALVKSFIPTDQFEQISGKLENGVTLMARGTVRADDFIHELTLVANSLMLCALPFEADPEVMESYSSMVVGMPYTAGELRPLRNIENVHGDVTVEGQVILHEAKEDRSGGLSLIIDITDGTGSVSVYSRTDKERYKEIASDLKAGRSIQVHGTVEPDFHGEHSHIRAKAIRRIKKNFRPERQDTYPEKRVELHMHSKMSEMDAVSSPTELVQQAARWGHPAVAITDHGVCQGFPEAMTAADGLPIKVIYGVEVYLVDDLQDAVTRDQGQKLDDEFVVFDIETTGFNKESDQIIEIGAVKIRGGEVIDRFSSFIDPGRHIPDHITKLTSITDEDVAGSDPIEKVLPRFIDFIGKDAVVAHNAGFDTGFIAAKALALGLPAFENTVVDTLALSRGLYNTLKKYTLDAVCRHLGISLENHHRAVDDAEACAGIFIQCVKELEEREVADLSGINELIRAGIDAKRLKAYHAIVLVKDLAGLRNLYELVSISHLQYFFRTPRVPKSVFNRLREGLMIGTACSAGELYSAVLEEDGQEVLDRLADFYDYFEIQPLTNNEYLVREGRVADDEALRNINRRIVELGEHYGKPVVATCDAHFTNPEDGIFRKIILAGKGMDDADQQADLYFRTTNEMLDEFAYLGEEKAHEVVIDNPLRISEQIEKIKPIPDGTYTPEIPGANEELEQITHDRAKSIYGDPLPEIVQARLDRELGSIIKHGFASLYIIAQRLVKHSNEDGYVVGSRGSVGSSFVATMAGITEVNPLQPHYVCPNCHYSEFDSEEIRANADKSGFDLPDKVCPKCGTMLAKNGHTIPFETFLGFNGDKEPDIDLNFSGEYQPRAHAFTEELFGKDHVFRAGTMGGLAEKTAYGYVMKYLESHNRDENRAEVNRLVAGCTGVRRTTGQHPGGQIVVPKGYSIYQFCPVQYPANKAEAGTITTHFDYHQLHDRLLKLDILGHDDPTMIRMLSDLTGLAATDIPLDDKKVMSLFLNTDALGVTPEQIGSKTGTYGVPEFGTPFVRGMLLDTKPKSFSDLVRISGLSHGTDVWNNNASDIIAAGEATISDVICTRDDIMTALIRHKMDNLYAFKTMEAVRKGKGIKEDDEIKMREAGVPEWFIRSCKKIKYLFPKGHATAYVMMALRVAYYKVYYKEAYYAAFFSIRAKVFDYESMCFGEQTARAEKARIEALGKDATDKDKDEVTALEIVIEAYCRGVQFAPISLEESGAERFKLTKDNRLLPPFTALPGMGAQAAKSIVEAREKSPFITVDDFAERAKVSKTILEDMRRLHILEGLPESMQMSLF